MIPSADYGRIARGSPAAHDSTAKPRRFGTGRAMRVRSKRLATILAGAALLTATAAAGYAAHDSPASCWIAGPDNVVHSHTIDGWRVQACVFDRVLNGRVTDQTGISAIAIPPPASQPEPLPRTQPTRIFHYRSQGR